MLKNRTDIDKFDTDSDSDPDPDGADTGILTTSCYSAIHDKEFYAFSFSLSLCPGILPVFAPGSLTTRLLVVPASDGIIFYAASWAHAHGIMKSKIKDSFGNRAEALFRWFVDKSKGFVKQENGGGRSRLLFVQGHFFKLRW